MIPGRITDPRTVDRTVLEATIREGRTPVVQFSEPGYDEAILREINALCAEFGSNIEVRFYGHYDSTFDARWLRFVPEVVHLSVDCLLTIEHPEVIGYLPHLRRLSLGVHKLDRPDILDVLPLEDLEVLRLCETRKADVRLAPLQRCRSLRTLHLAGHTRDFDTLAQLDSVSDLTLASIPSKQSVAAVSSMRGLRELGLILGGRDNIDEIGHPDLRVLEVVRVRGLSSLGALSRFPSLETLRIEDQLRLISLDVTRSLPNVRTLTIANCKKLSKVTGLDTLTRLETLVLSMTPVDLEDLARSGFPKSLKTVRVHTGTKRGNDAAHEFLTALGYEID